MIVTVILKGSHLDIFSLNFRKTKEKILKVSKDICYKAAQRAMRDI